MTQVRVNLSTLVNAASIRREKRDGRDVIIVPSATLPDNVVMSGRGNGPSKGAIMYPAEEIEKAYRALEGSPAPLGHPVVNGKFVLARSPEGLARSYVGAHNENVRREGGRVLLDKVIDVQVANQSQGGRDLLAAIKKRGPIHTSTGALATLEKAPEGLPHNFVARNLLLEHDAILLNEAGAATPEQGVGIFVNAAGDELEVINSTVDDVKLPPEEIMLRKGFWERMIALVNDVDRGEPEPATPAKEIAAMDKAQFDELVAKVNAIADAKPGLTEEKVAEIVANALKPVIDAQEAADKAAKEKAETERQTLVNQVVEAEILTKDEAKEVPAAALSKLLANGSAPKPAFRVNGAFKGGNGDKPGFTAPKGDD